MIQKKIYSYFDGNPQLRTLFVFDSMGGILNELEDLEWRDGGLFFTYNDIFSDSAFRIIAIFGNGIFPSF